MPLILPRRNLLTYPSGVPPGFDPTHPAAKGISFSVIPSFGGGNLTNIIARPTAGTLTVTPTYSVQSIIGPAINFTSTQKISTSTATVAANIGGTVAAIVSFTSFAAAVQWWGNNNNATSLQLSNATTMIVTGNSATLNVTMGWTMAVNTPYFIVVSGQNSGVKPLNIVMVNLATGQLLVKPSAWLTGFWNSYSSVQWGNENNGTRPINGYIAA